MPPQLKDNIYGEDVVMDSGEARYVVFGGFKSSANETILKISEIEEQTRFTLQPIYIYITMQFSISK